MPFAHVIVGMAKWQVRVEGVGEGKVVWWVRKGRGWWWPYYNGCRWYWGGGWWWKEEVEEGGRRKWRKVERGGWQWRRHWLVWRAKERYFGKGKGKVKTKVKTKRVTVRER